jgi:cytochrome P450
VPLPPPPDRFDLLSPETVEDPYPFYASLRAHAPVWEIPGTRAFLVSTWKLVEEVLARHAEFSAQLTGILAIGADGRPQLLDLAGAGTFTDSIANADEPEHAVHRAIVQPAFAAPLVDGLEPELRRRTRERIAGFVASGGGEFVQVAEWVPTFATARVAGFPLEDFERLRVWGMTGGDLLAVTADLPRLAAMTAQTREMTEYLRALLGAALARARAGDASREAMADRVARAVLSGELPERHALGILVVLLGAGIESTASLIGNAVRLLAERPGLQAELRRERALVSAFVEEAVRLESPFRFHYRLVARAGELGGVALRPGDRLLLSWASANRDEAVFERPDEIDLRRRFARHHLAFGRGIHFCVGAPLARLETRVVVEELLDRARRIELDPARPPRYVPSLFVRRHAALALRAVQAPRVRPRRPGSAR